MKQITHRIATETATIGYALLWVLGIPLPILLIIYLVRGHWHHREVPTRRAPGKLSSLLRRFIFRVIPHWHASRYFRPASIG